LSDRIPFRVRPMLATAVDRPLHRPGWVYEEKYDGYRILAYKEGRTVTLLSRNGKQRTESFAEIAAAVAQLDAQTMLLDGEAVAFDERLVSRFQLLQRHDVPVIYVVFDCLYLNGRDLRREPLRERRRALEDAVQGSERLFPSRRLGSNGLVAYRLARKTGYEGVVAKDLSSEYVEGRSMKWLKVKVTQEEEFVIGGYTTPAGSRSYFGALLLGAYGKPGLHYVGKVGTGFSTDRLASLWKSFRPLVQEVPPFVDPPRERGVTWLAPQLVAQVAFSEWTDDRRLRQPVFLGLRDDKAPRECVLPKDQG
jgi:bifunctional non-homologous end joining protein LigD